MPNRNTVSETETSYETAVVRDPEVLGRMIRECRALGHHLLDEVWEGTDRPAIVVKDVRMGKQWTI